MNSNFLSSQGKKSLLVKQCQHLHAQRVIFQRSFSRLFFLHSWKCTVCWDIISLINFWKIGFENGIKWTKKWTFKIWTETQTDENASKRLQIFFSISPQKNHSKSMKNFHVIYHKSEWSRINWRNFPLWKKERFLWVRFLCVEWLWPSGPENKMWQKLGKNLLISEVICHKIKLLASSP